MRKTLLTIVLMLSALLPTKAHEGMWMLNNLTPETVKLMQALGLKLDAQGLYNPNGVSLKDCVVSFGGFCSGVVVSPDGLVFTNHHCGYESIQQHSSTEHDYLKNGFITHNRSEELPNPDLHVSFLLRTEDVTERVLGAVPSIAGERERSEIIDSICTVIQNEVIENNPNLSAIVSPYFQGNEYYLSVYKDYKDVRLVFAPPSSIGKFGGDTDNWMWPRHTGDFSVFRIYADANNEPAEYSEDNVPYHPVHYAPISMKGYKEGDFSMTVGYPGSTDRYMSSFGIYERMTGWNAAMIQVRGVKQEIWRKAMDADADTRIKYDAKYAQSSNYWKNSIGMNQSIEKLKILEQKRELEQKLQEWVAQKPAERAKYANVISELKNAYENRAKVNRAFYFIYESFFNSSDVLQTGLMVLRIDPNDEEDGTKAVKQLIDSYENININLDKQVFAAMLKNYKEQVPDYLPETYTQIDSVFNGNIDAFTDAVYEKTNMAERDSMLAMMARNNNEEIMGDPIMSMAIDLMVYMQELRGGVMESSMTIETNERLLNAAIREMDITQPYYSDANSTMRMSYGIVSSYTMSNGQNSNYYCNPAGLLAKAATQGTNPDYFMQPEVVTLFAKGDFGKYKDKRTKDLNLCFVSNNDITGGNSGSPVFNGKGELIGLAFDGNWEAMSSDIAFDSQLQRCINVDIRYVLFMMDKWGAAESLLKELKLK